MPITNLAEVIAQSPEALFRKRLEELCATLLEPNWLGGNIKHHVICCNGHDCYPSPYHVLSGQGICRTCKYENHMVGNKAAVASEQNFRACLIDIGATLLEDKYLGSQVLHRVTCVNGHACRVRPALVNYGRGICRACVGLDPIQAEQKFLRRLDELGAIPMYERWMGANTPHNVRCVNGHYCAPRPSSVTSRAKQGICKICAGNDSAVAEKNFRENVTKQGGECLFDTYSGANTLHLIRCKSGHEAWTMPNRIQQGGGICNLCAGHYWNIFYVVVNPRNEVVKFGITSWDEDSRLNTHKRNGFTERILVCDIDDAERLELNIIQALRDAGMTPVKGREYFNMDAMPLILDLAQNWQ